MDGEVGHRHDGGFQHILTEAEVRHVAVLFDVYPFLYSFIHSLIHSFTVCTKHLLHVGTTLFKASWTQG